MNNNADTAADWEHNIKELALALVNAWWLAILIAMIVIGCVLVARMEDRR